MNSASDVDLKLSTHQSKNVLNITVIKFRMFRASHITLQNYIRVIGQKYVTFMNERYIFNIKILTIFKKKNDTFSKIHLI